MTRPFGKKLWLWVAGGVVAGVVLVWFAGQASALRDPVVLFLVCPLIALLLWAMTDGIGPSSAVPWNPGWDFRPTPHAGAEVSRTLQSIAQASAGDRRGNTRVGELLADGVSAALVARHGADPADPLAHADRYLSPELYEYLASSLSGESTLALSRRTLDTYLKEIDSL